MFPGSEVGACHGVASLALQKTFTRAPTQTDAKSRLIATYLSLFQLVTKSGYYIDGFAAPQSREHEDAWTARRVLEITPPRLTKFWLCDLEPRGLEQLRALKAVHDRVPRGRRVSVMGGDFNETAKMLMNNIRLPRHTPIFALLDQRNTECHWSTVQLLAQRRPKRKIELLYFLGTGWLHRSLSQSISPERLAEIDLWWGRPDWRTLVNMTTVGVLHCVTQRFVTELNYRYVNSYPIYRTEAGMHKAFYLIHASDHPEARKLMSRAFFDVVGDTPEVDLGTQGRLSF